MPHIHETLDHCSEVLIVHKNKVLLRKHDKYKVWLSVGGHIEPGEDPAECAVREVKEEVGLDVALYSDDPTAEFNRDGWWSLPRPQFVNRHHITDVHDHVAFVFFATSERDQLTLCEDEKSDGCHWFTREEIEGNEEIRPEIRHYALEALRACSNS